MSDPRFGSSSSVLSYPFHDETVERMGHPAGTSAGMTREKINSNQSDRNEARGFWSAKGRWKVEQIPKTRMR